MTTTPQLIVRREHSLPSDRLLRRAARKAEAAGLGWELVVAVPPLPGFGFDGLVETLVVGDRAAQRDGFRVKWGRWSEEEQAVHFEDGRVLDVCGRAVRRRGVR